MSEHGPRAGRLFVALGALLVFGAPIAGVAWHQLSHLLSGDATPRGLLLMGGALAVFAGMSLALMRYVTRLDEGPGGRHAGESRPQGPLDR